MSDLAERFSQLGPKCRHWSALAHIRRENGCGIGHPIAKIVTAANGGDSAGLLLMLPCKPGPDAKAKCPDYDPKTAEELAADRAAMDASIARFLKGMPVFNALREEMVAGGVSAKTIDCPYCDAVGAMHVTCAIGVNNHLWAKCSACGEGFME